MQNVDMTIANIALPHMQSALSAGQEQIGWVVTSYIASTAIAIPLAGYLGARFGLRRLLLTAVSGFTFASIGCATAQTQSQLVIFRIFQGAFGAGLIPMSQAILLDVYPREKHGQAMALWGIGVMIGPILGPLVGGYLTDAYSWRAIFFINLPVGAATFLAIVAAVPRDSSFSRRPFDLAGFLMLALAIGLLQVMIDRGASQGWFDSTEVMFGFVLSGLFLYLFVVHVLTAERAFLEPALFLDRNFTTALFLNFVFGGVFFANLAIMPMFVQTIGGYPILTAAVLLVPRGIGMMLGMLIVGRLLARGDPRLPAALGILLIVISLFEVTQFTGNTAQWPIVHTGFFQGFGLGLLYVPLSTMAFATLKRRFRAEGVAVFNLTRNIGSSLITAGVFALLIRNAQVNHAELAAQINPISLLLRPSWSPLEWHNQSAHGLAAIEAEIIYQAASISFLNSFRMMMWLSLIVLPLILLFRRPGVQPEDSTVSESRAVGHPV